MSMVTRRKDLAPVKPNINCFGYGNKKKTLTIHQTGNTNKGANADMHARLQKNNPREASWHWQVDDKEAVQSFEHSVSCYHASDGSGEGNMNSIAIEGCINSDGNYKKSVQNLAELAAWILKTENIPLTNMKQHYDWARDKKNCPAQIRGGKDGIDWTKFVQMVQAELNKLNGKPTVSGAKSYKLVATVNGYINAGDAKNKKNAKTKVKAGNYIVFSEANGMINVATKSGVPGSWINPSDNKAPVAVTKPSASNQSGNVEKYAEAGVFYPNDTIIVRDRPSTAGTIVARYYAGEHVTYHTVHKGNGYVWLQYTRGNGQQAYIPCREYKNGKYGALWGTIK